MAPGFLATAASAQIVAVARLSKQRVDDGLLDLDEVDIVVPVDKGEMDLAAHDLARARVAVLDRHILGHGDVFGEDEEQDRDDLALPLLSAPVAGLELGARRFSHELELVDIGLEQFVCAKRPFGSRSRALAEVRLVLCGPLL
jgi:hypothetical protein